MSWTISSVRNNQFALATETHTLPNATTNYTEKLEILAPDLKREKKYASFVVTYPGSLAGNITTNLYGAMTVGGAKVLLAVIKSASSTAGDYTAQIDLNAYPALEYYVGFIAAGNDAARSATLAVFA
jgi:hypothetical protein